MNGDDKNRTERRTIEVDLLPAHSAQIACSSPPELLPIPLAESSKYEPSPPLPAVKENFRHRTCLAHVREVRCR